VTSRLVFDNKITSNMPKIVNALDGWQDELTIVRVTESWSGGDKVETTENIGITGTIQPLSPKQVSLKPEGQRAWKWYQIHDYTRVSNLDTSDRIIIEGKKYKVMAINDYSRNNYIEYHIIEFYE